MSDHAALSCPRCQIGVLQPTLATYCGIYHGMVISVPNMPSWTCDICNYREYEPSAQAQVSVLLGQLEMASAAARTPTKKTSLEADAFEGTPPGQFKP